MTNTKDLIKKHNVLIKKKYGQNFLTDQNIIKRIIDVSMVDDDTHVVEIGPGLGALSEHLIDKVKSLVAYEIDGDLINPLQRIFSKSNNVALYHKDFLKTDFKEDLKALPFIDGKVTVVANLPYYITTPILFKCLDYTSLIDKMVFMTQYEVAKRLTASTNTKDYNALSVTMHYLCHASFAFKVPKDVFIPTPNVDSAVITLDVKKNRPNIDEAFFFDFVKTSFKQKRKTLVNNLSKGYQIDKATIIQFLDTFKLSSTVRAEAINVDTFVKLSEQFKVFL